MKIEQKQWHHDTGWKTIQNEALDEKATLVFVFGPSKMLSKERFLEIKDFYTDAEIVMCAASTSIINAEISNDCIALTAMHFEKTKVQTIQVNINDVKDSFDVGAHISASLDKDDLTSVMVISDSQPLINGSHVLTGMYFNLSSHIPITGGLAASDDDSTPTSTGLNTVPTKGNVIAIGFFGSAIQIGHGMGVGWTPFGTERFVTKAKDMTLHKLDDMTALEFYTHYLDGLVDNIPDASQQFPLGIKYGENRRLVRSVLSVNEEDGSITFSGDIAEDETVRMMKTNISNLIDAAGTAARSSLIDFAIEKPDFALLVNCIGKQNVLEDWAQEELDAVLNNLGKSTPLLGFYSSGEISPMSPKESSKLHNQALTITTFKEA